MKNTVIIGLIVCALLSATVFTTANADQVDRADRKASALAPRTPKTVFDETAATEALKEGNVEIKSVLFECYGRIIDCALGNTTPVTNTNVHLYPDTPYLQEVLKMEKQLKADIKKHPDYAAVKLNLDPKFSKLSLAAKTDEFGRYSFKNMKPGKYYVLSENVVGHKTVVGHYYDDYGVDHPRQVDSPADLGFDKVIEITQTDGVYKFDSKMVVLHEYGPPRGN